MKDRMTLGFNADAAETAALTLADNRATERIFDALDWEADERERDLVEKRRRKREEKRRNRAVKRVEKILGAVYAEVLRAWLNGRAWSDIGIPRRTFGDRLKKVKDFFHA